MKKRTMVKTVVPVSFAGVVEVEVPADIPSERREGAGPQVALARVLATTKKPDAPEDNTCAEHAVEFGLDEATAKRNWDASKTTGISGQWSPQAADHAAVVDRLVEKAASAGLQPEDMDEMVHDLASSFAADANNGGLDEQVKYLVEGLGAQHTERQIDELIGERQGKEE